MARSSKYTTGLMTLDIVLTVITGGLWLLVVLFRELYRRS